MNPSKDFWITKFLKIVAPSLKEETNESSIYNALRACGFIYGYTVYVPNDHLNPEKWSLEERTKITLLDALAKVYLLHHSSFDQDHFIDSLHHFYHQFSKTKAKHFFEFISFEKKSATATLEKVFDERVQTQSNILEKTFSHNLTNFLLFVDILCYRRYLSAPEEIFEYYLALEKNILQLTLLSYHQKAKPSMYDKKLTELLKNSVRFTTEVRWIEDLHQLDLEMIRTLFGKRYLYDISLMVLWSDQKIDTTEQLYLKQLSRKLHLNAFEETESQHAMASFLKKHKHEIPFFQFHHPFKKFYQKSYQNLELILQRNKSSLKKELANNKVLFQLITKSTYQSLDSNEKKMVKKQLIELSKTIPALTILILPGGSILLPLLLKIIPDILPDTFNENKN